MTNKELIKEFIRGNRRYGATNHLGYTDNKLYNYSTVICEIDRANRKALFNCRKYSTTTGRIQSTLRAELEMFGFTVEEFYGAQARMWNFGYQGAKRWTAREFKPVESA